MKLPIQISEETIADLCRRYRIQRVGLFGSILRDDFTSESDVDVLVEFEPGAKTTYLDMVDLQDELVGIFGRPVDVGTYDMLSPHIRDRVIGSEQMLYERHYFQEAALYGCNAHKLVRQAEPDDLRGGWPIEVPSAAPSPR